MKNFLIFTLLSFIAWNIGADAAPAQIMIIRHAEKPPKGESLSTKGRERAAAFAPFFMETKELLIHGTPIAIYAMKPAKADLSERPIETVTPLAEALKLTINQTYERDDYKRMVDEIMNNLSYHEKSVLICWDHSVIPEIARAFKAFQSPNRWQPEIFDRTWLITSGVNGKVTFQNLPQRLMYGDTSN